MAQIRAKPTRVPAGTAKPKHSYTMGSIAHEELRIISSGKALRESRSGAAIGQREAKCQNMEKQRQDR